ncbi:hypothetical protein G3N95_30980 [Paraburkholderia sp. Tr-20389]|uniref:hypothetical protein n=1 Tax=Paraburkholderia sp. Tr-20389 TaxID=2703903 RepID=UPI00197DDF01|nr:hypothetical protein [Paraburkholderia sp. Tr-20389]MBN3757393.1 hypothetical protein [Paraburkholderia sp. Tr-20389]
MQKIERMALEKATVAGGCCKSSTGNSTHTSTSSSTSTSSNTNTITIVVKSA